MQGAVRFFAALLSFALFPAVACAESRILGPDRVLVLHSYSPDFVWTRSQQEGIDAVFAPLAAVYDVQIEYLDAVHHPELRKGPLLVDLLRAKLADRRPRIVLTSDNAAFDFARAHRDTLFPDAPIVFMGVNGYDDSMVRDQRDITGVAEDTDLAGTLRLILQLLPTTKRIVFPGMIDDLTYRAIRSTIGPQLQTLPADIATEFPEYRDVDAALEALRTLPPDSAIVVMTNMRTRGGEGISSQRVVELIAGVAPVPVFTNWDFVIGHGALGGSVISGVEQGRLAAETALRILRGVQPAAIPVHRGAGKTFLFDYRQLARFGIPTSRLPAGAVIRFTPDGSLKIPREAAWTAAVSFVLLLLVTASLILSIRRRRRAEKRVHALNRELEQRVCERTEQLEAANKELEGFSYSMSHDMRTPLRALDGFAAILQEKYGEGLDDDGRRLLKALRDNARQQGRLVDDILLFLALGRQKMHPAAIDIGALAAKIFEELQAAAPSRRMGLKAGKLPSAWGDPVMIRLVLQNLLSNAVKHSPEDRSALVEIGSTTANGENVYSVTDHGVGFDMRYADKLFKVFQRVHPTGRFEGSGVGLAIVKRVVERHGGRVWAEGSEDEGATFYFALPTQDSRNP